MFSVDGYYNSCNANGHDKNIPFITYFLCCPLLVRFWNTIVDPYARPPPQKKKHTRTNTNVLMSSGDKQEKYNFMFEFPCIIS